MGDALGRNLRGDSAQRCERLYVLLLPAIRCHHPATGHIMFQQAGACFTFSFTLWTTVSYLRRFCFRSADVHQHVSPETDSGNDSTVSPITSNGFTSWVAL